MKMLSHSAETGFTAEHQIEYENISQIRGGAEVADWLLFFFFVLMLRSHSENENENSPRAKS